MKIFSCDVLWIALKLTYLLPIATLAVVEAVTSMPGYEVTDNFLAVVMTEIYVKYSVYMYSETFNT